jgi:integrase
MYVCLFAPVNGYLGKEIAQLNSDFARLHPPKLNVVGQLWIDPVAEKPASECITWYDRLDALKAYRKWTSTTDRAKTVDGNIAEYLKVKEAAARTGQIKPASYDVFIHRLAYLRRFCGTTAIDQLNARTLSGFLAHLNERIICGDIRPATAQGILRAVRSFVRWLYKTETIENWPRNLDDLHVRVELQEIIPFTRDEISKLLAGASDRTRLYLLLMLNCGFYQQDVADLAHAEVDWEQGRIIRKRSKTSKQKNVPKVNYKLWPATFELLKRFRSEHRTWVLVNENGSPLRQRGFRADGKTHNLDNIKKAYERVCDKLKRECKPLKLFRKTGASKLEEHETYGRYAQYYLGHAPDSVAESRYARPSDEQFDRALQWLGEQFDIK